jgi:hypothetical protein
VKVKLIYFKRSGKYYTSGEYETQREHMFQIYEEVGEFRQQGFLPGLVNRSEGHTFVVLVEVPDHPNNVPQLIGADDADGIVDDLFKLGPRHDRQYAEATAADALRWADWDADYIALAARAEKLGIK